ncbi:PA2169 family four-helix-bundle protein [Panacibacter sp. DH6]|uniref:PA2169 family four-helix-bundle protein n=1 Tax=Panacibacter microcysteis TaxID=2793269 RepID=A0A931MCW5_9BACT|nr:PA2169 family four-helix-bundle protein [Panacibacter microcysteis]MBG9378305.1 PA2169 family four-helix-bundle protein [Panacibacter microcysteis]
MNNSAETAEILNDLIEIHNDRIVGYEKAVKELKDEDEDLKILFTGLVGQSHQCKLELGTEVQVLGKDMETGTTNRGKIYRVWMDVKAAFTAKSSHAILESCEFGEDAAQRAYEDALSSEHLPAYIREMLEKQRAVLLASHNEVKALRDQYA